MKLQTLVINDPIVNPRTVAFWTQNDPLGYRRDYRHEFEHIVYDAVETESKAVVYVSDKALKEGNAHNDRGTFGGSIKEAIQDAEGFYEDLQGASVDVVVKTTVKTRLVFPHPYETTSLMGHLRCLLVPTWWVPREEGVKASDEQEYEVWKNGFEMDAKDATVFEGIVEVITETDRRPELIREAAA
jgi:hypothetical protein